jgi:hypothetical protein
LLEMLRLLPELLLHARRLRLLRQLLSPRPEQPLA